MFMSWLIEHMDLSSTRKAIEGKVISNNKISNLKTKLTCIVVYDIFNRSNTHCKKEPSLLESDGRIIGNKLCQVNNFFPYKKIIYIPSSTQSFLIEIVFIVTY